MQHHTTDTIAAIATPHGLGGVAVIRLSGPSAKSILARMFRPFGESTEQAFSVARYNSGSPIDENADASFSAFSFKPRYLHYGYACAASGERLDIVLAVFMPGPNSFTGEDVAEIHCHGGKGVAAAILDETFLLGARLATGGEFTRRALLNGRMDITQAEAVAEMIAAPTRESARLAQAKLEGALARRISRIRENLDALRMQVILAVDFPDEEAELLSRDGFLSTAVQAIHEVESLVQAFERARLWREGALAVLAGSVNAGKSSLLNALLGRERAIVSPSPGTTRDYIEETLNLKGIPLRIMDTAGLREGGDLVEVEGIRRTRDLAGQADILVAVLDASREIVSEEVEFVRKHTDRKGNHKLLLVLNKAEMAIADARMQNDPAAGRADGGATASEVPEAEPGTVLPSCEQLLSLVDPESLLPPVAACYSVSARLGVGIEALAEGIHEALRQSGGDSFVESGESDVAPNLRQSRLLEEAAQELQSLAAAVRAGHPADILGVHLEAAMQLLDEVTGSSDNEELLDRIFASFCIGK